MSNANEATPHRAQVSVLAGPVHNETAQPLLFFAFWKRRDLQLERSEGDHIYAEEGWKLGYTG